MSFQNGHKVVSRINFKDIGTPKVDRIYTIDGPEMVSLNGKKFVYLKEVLLNTPCGNRMTFLASKFEFRHDWQEATDALEDLVFEIKTFNKL